MRTCSRTARKTVAADSHPQTVKHVHRLLHKAFEDALKKQLVSANVIHPAQPPAVERRELDAPDEDTMALLIVEAKKLGYMLPVVIACGTGLRRGEVLGAKWKDYSAATGELRVMRSLSETKDDLFLKDGRNN